MLKKYNLDVFKNLLVKKRDLLKCVFSTLLFQVSVTSLVLYFIRRNNYLNNSYFEGLKLPITVIIINTCLIFAMLSKNMEFNHRFILFVLFSIVNGVLLGVVTKYFSINIINAALASTCLIFILFLIVGFVIVYFKIDLSWMRVFLLYALLGYIIYLIASYFIPVINGYERYATTFGLIMFSVFILYDTNNILLKYSDTNIDCIRGSLSYYQDIINIFVHMLRKRRR